MAIATPLRGHVEYKPAHSHATSLLYRFKIYSKYCSGSLQKRLLSCFSTNKFGKVLAICNSCRTTQAERSNKWKSLQELDPNHPSKRHVTGRKTITTTPRLPQSRANPPSILEPGAIAPGVLESRVNPPAPVEWRPDPPSVLNTRKWQRTK